MCKCPFKLDLKSLHDADQVVYCRYEPNFCEKLVWVSPLGLLLSATQRVYRRGADFTTQQHVATQI